MINAANRAVETAMLLQTRYCCTRFNALQQSLITIADGAFLIKARQLWANPSLILGQLSSDFAAICPREVCIKYNRDACMQPFDGLKLAVNWETVIHHKRSFIRQWLAFNCRQIRLDAALFATVNSLSSYCYHGCHLYDQCLDSVYAETSFLCLYFLWVQSSTDKCVSSLWTRVSIQAHSEIYIHLYSPFLAVK